MVRTSAYLIIAENTILVPSTDSDLYNLLKTMTPGGDVDPVQAYGDRR